MGDALGEGVIYVRTPAEGVADAITPGGGPARGEAGCLFPTLTASCLCWCILCGGPWRADVERKSSERTKARTDPGKTIVLSHSLA